MAQCYRNSGSLKNGMAAQAHRTSGSFAPRLFNFYDKFEDSPNPRLKRISDVRNALEHKYVKVTNGWFTERTKGEIDDLALYVTESELSSLTLELMHIVREAIICLSLCVHVEEQKKQKENEGKFIPSMPLMEYDDDWKI